MLNWMPTLQPSVALESYLENVKVKLAEITVTKPKDNLSRDEVTALKELKNNSAINLKKADKGTTTVIINETEAKVQPNSRYYYKPPKALTVKKMQEKVNEIINHMHRGNDNDYEMAYKNALSDYNTFILYAHENTQTYTSLKTINATLWLPSWENIIICGNTTPAYRANTTILY